jgi:hypothetical protein
MVARHDHQICDAGQALIGERAWNHRKGPHDAGTAPSIEHGLNGGAKRLDIDA